MASLMLLAACDTTHQAPTDQELTTDSSIAPSSQPTISSTPTERTKKLSPITQSSDLTVTASPLQWDLAQPFTYPIEAYLSGDLSVDQAPLYIQTLLEKNSNTIAFDLKIPDSATLYGSEAGTTLPYVGYLLLPQPDLVQSAFSQATLYPPNIAQLDLSVTLSSTAIQKYPLIIYSHGLGSDPLEPSFFENLLTIATHGYAVLALFHGDNRFATPPTYYQSWPQFYVRGAAISAAIDFLNNHDSYRYLIDFNKIGGLGNSLGGSTMLSMAGAEVIRNIEGYTTAIHHDDRIKAIALINPYLGESLFGYGGVGAKSLAIPLLTMTGEQDELTSQYAYQSLLKQVKGPRYLINLLECGHD
ncbi:MAG: hypothetical protein HQL49_12680, partial [Gammaproteobacteria bacterium]|nr:hypothetical protein [Gammaproteobacteria bacterium]